MYTSMKNKVQLIGNLGGEPELKDLGNGKHVLKLRLATNEPYKGADGVLKDNTEWHSVVVWDKQAERLAGLVHKGSALMIEGRLVHRRYETKDGAKRVSSEVVLSDFQLIGPKPAVAEM